MLYIRSPQLIHLIIKTLYPYNNLFHYSHPPTGGFIDCCLDPGLVMNLDLTLCQWKMGKLVTPDMQQHWQVKPPITWLIMMKCRQKQGTWKGPRELKPGRWPQGLSVGRTPEQKHCC